MITEVSLMIDVLTIGVGVLGIVGISVVGIQYLMAGENEIKVKRSKNRMFEILIGLTVYAIVTVVLKWLQFCSVG